MLRVLIATIVIALASPALAGQRVTLRAEVLADGPVTLGDLFENAGQASGIRIDAVVRPGGSVSLDAAAVQRIARSAGLEWDNAQGFRRIIVRAGAGGASPGLRGGESVEVLTYVRNLNTGDVVEADDLAWGEAVGAPAGAPKDAEDIIGKVAKRPLRAGAAVSGRDVTAAQVIKRDDVVQVTFRDGGVSLTLQAKAMEAAAVGETFKVQNVASKKIIEALATGPGRAVIGPEADRIRAAAAPSTLASR